MLECNIKKKLRDFELELGFAMDHKTTVIVGHSGCGKSTTLKILAGLMKPDEGYISVGQQTFFDDKNKLNVVPEERGVGFVFQNYALFPHLSVYGNVAYGLNGKKISKSEKQKKVGDILKALNIENLIDSMPSDLSGGEQQRVALARALVLEPRVLLLDEPLSALDVTTRAHVRRELKKTLSSLDIPTIIVSHDYEDAISLGDRILVMDQGRIIQDGTAKELLIRPRSAFVADFSGTNFFSGEAAESEVGLTVLQVSGSGHKLRSAHKGEGKLSFMIYPWDIELIKDGRTPPAINSVQGKVINILAYGNRARVEIEGPLPLTAEITAEALEELNIKENDNIYSLIDPANVKVLE